MCRYLYHEQVFYSKESADRIKPESVRPGGRTEATDTDQTAGPAASPAGLIMQ